MDNSIPCVGLEEQSRGKMWADERDVGDQLILYWTHLKTLRKGLLLHGAPRITCGTIWSCWKRSSWSRTLFKSCCLAFPFLQMPPVTSLERGKAGRRSCWFFLVLGVFASCPTSQARPDWILEVFSSHDHSAFLRTLKFPVKHLPQVLEPQ